MFQAIQTKYLPATNTRGSRVKASCEAGSVTVPWDYSGGNQSNHTRAAQALVEKLGWVPAQGANYAGDWVGGGLGNRGCVFVFHNATSTAFTLA
mgnify:CR=1 FL=1